jgi:hypothetical protein
MSNGDSNPVPRRKKSVVGQWAKYVCVGALAGLALGILVVFVAAFFFGAATGLPAGACTALACVTTVLLSESAGFIGMIVGVSVGALAGAVVHYARHFWHAV